MKKIYLFLLLGLVTHLGVKAQNAASYNFEVANSTVLEDMTGATELIGTLADDVSSNVTALPFTFNFAGTNYQQFSVSSNGLLGFGAEPVNSIGEDNLITQSTTYPILAPWWEDLYTAANGGVSYKVVGTGVGQRLVVEWRVRRFSSNSRLVYDKVYQAWLYRGTNRITFVYGEGTYNAFTSATVGIASSANDFINVNTADNSIDSVNSFNTNVFPAAGTSYIFSPVGGIIEAPVATVTVDGATEFCNGGAVVLSATSNAAIISYQWLRNNVVVAGATGSSFTATESGDYSVIITTENGVATSSATTVTVNPSPVATFTAVNVNCFGASNGSFTVSATGGTSPYTFSSNGVTNTDGQFSNLSAGTYTVVVTDAKGCNSTVNVTIAEPAALDAALTTTGASCGGGLGSVIVNNAKGGSGTYEYRLNNGAWQSANTFTGLAAGTYQVEMRDAASTSCTKSLGSATVNPAGAQPVVTINVQSNAFCSTITLTAQATGDASYTWSNGATTPSIVLNVASADGNYTVTATASTGCTATATYNFQKQNHLSVYTVLGLKAVVLGENNIVKGAVGNTGNNNLIIINRNSNIDGFVKGDFIIPAPGVTVSGGLYYSAATVTLPAMLLNTSNTNNLPNLTVSDDSKGRVIAGNYNTVTIGKRAQVTLTGSIYKKVVIKEGADVSFTAHDISVDEMETEDGKVKNGTTDYTTVTFAANTNLRVKTKVTIGESNRIQGAGSTIYLGDTKPDAEKISINGAKTTVSVNIYMPHGLMSISGTDSYNKCTMTGTFIAEYILSDKYVTWNSYNCATSVITRMASPVQEAVALQEAEEATFLPATTGAKLKAYPNPSRGQFTLQVNNEVAAKGQVVILNAAGVAVMQRNIEISNVSTLQFNLANYPKGVYLVKVTVGNTTSNTSIIIQ